MYSTNPQERNKLLKLMGISLISLYLSFTKNDVNLKFLEQILN